MILHPATGEKISPRKFAKYALRNAIEGLAEVGVDFRPRWQGDLMEAASMTERERKLVHTQIEHMIKSMTNRHNLQQDGSEYAQ